MHAVLDIDKLLYKIANHIVSFANCHLTGMCSSTTLVFKYVLTVDFFTSTLTNDILLVSLINSIKWVPVYHYNYCYRAACAGQYGLWAHSNLDSRSTSSGQMAGARPGPSPAAGLTRCTVHVRSCCRSTTQHVCSLFDQRSTTFFL